MKNRGVYLRKFFAGAFFLIAVMSFSNSCEKKDMGTNGDTGNEEPVTQAANEVFIQGSSFSPQTITVTVNTTVTWINKDAMAHTVTSNSGLFNSGTLAKNGVFSYTFTTAGTYNYICTLHAAMTGKVVVN